MPFDDVKHAQRERLVFLDSCFAWRGLANRRDLVERFGVSNPQAALDFKLYLEQVGDPAPAYDSVRKAYVVPDKFSPISLETVDQDLDHILNDSEGQRFDRLPTLHRQRGTDIVSKLYQAMTVREAIQISYTSMATGADSGQWIAPSRFASDGERIHVRAFSFKHGEYRDYVPIRIKNSSSFQCRVINEELPFDEDWHTVAKIYLKPKKSLSPQQARAVRKEYGFKGTTLCVETRKALEFYADRRWGLDQESSRLERVLTEYTPLDDEHYSRNLPSTLP